MIKTGKLNRQLDDSGASVLIEYMFLIVIMAIFFTMFLFLLNTVIVNSNRVVIMQELDIVANDVANRIVAFSGKVAIEQYNNTYWASDVSSNTEEIELPDMVNGKPYNVQVTYSDSTGAYAVKVTYGDDYSINSTAHFRSGTKVTPSMINSTGYNPRIYYEKTEGSIKLVDD